MNAGHGERKTDTRSHGGIRGGPVENGLSLQNKLHIVFLITLCTMVHGGIFKCSIQDIGMPTVVVLHVV